MEDLLGRGYHASGLLLVPRSHFPWVLPSLCEYLAVMWRVIISAKETRRLPSVVLRLKPKVAWALSQPKLVYAMSLDAGLVCLSSCLSPLLLVKRGE